MATAAFSVSPGAFLQGIDGNWTTFIVQAGTPYQTFNVFASTALSFNYLVIPLGCYEQSSSCATSRGGTFETGQSTSWGPIGTYQVLADSNLVGTDNTAEYGTDIVAVGYEGYGGLGLGSHLIAGVADDAYYLGYLGLLATPYSVGNYSDSHPSLLESFYNASIIPSLSWGYTAGAQYQLSGKGPMGSLTFGGYDASRFTPNGVSFTMQSIQATYLQVALQDVSIGSTSALSSPINVVLDSTLPFLWLPLSACQAFEKAYNLTYDSAQDLYLVSNDVHSALTSGNPPPVTLTLGSELSGGPTVDITMPYAAFDLTGVPPFATNTTYYFPLKQAANESQYTLGRAFFQQAYVIADFGRNNFSVSQALFETNNKPDLVGILPNITVTQKSNSGGSSTSPGAIAGGVVGGIIALVAIGVAIWFFRRRRNRSGGKRTKGLPHDRAELEGNNKRYSQIQREKNIEMNLQQAAPEHHPLHHQGESAGMMGFYAPGENEMEGKHIGSPATSPPTSVTSKMRSQGSTRTHDMQSPMSEMDGTNYFELPGENRNSVTDQHSAETMTDEGTSAPPTAKDDSSTSL